MSLSYKCLHFSCSKMPERLLYQSEAEQLVPERGLAVVETEVPFSVFLGTSGIQGANVAKNNILKGLVGLYSMTKKYFWEMSTRGSVITTKSHPKVSKLNQNIQSHSLFL